MVLAREMQEQSVKRYKRELVRGGVAKEWLDKLIWPYCERGQWARAELVARTLYAQIIKEKECVVDSDSILAKMQFRIGSSLAKCLEEQNRIPEAAKLYLELLKAEGATNISNCLKEIERIGYGAYSSDEKKLIYLFTRASGLKVSTTLHEQLRNVLSARRKAFELSSVASYAHFGEWVYFQVDHPDYVACACTLTKQFLFTKTRASVVDVVAGTKGEYPLIFPISLPDDVVLFGAKKVRWLLAKGYIPTIKGTKLLFSQPKVANSEAKNALLAKGVSLQAFCDALQDDALSSAYYYIHKAYIERKGAVEIAELYAEFLLFIKKPEQALELFSTLARNNKNEGYYLEKELFAACLCKSPEAGRLYKNLLRYFQRTQASEERVRQLILHGHLYFQGQDDASQEEFKRLFSNKLDADGSFVAHALALACYRPDDVERRYLLYQKLASTICGQEREYYTIKCTLEEASRSRGGVESFISQFAADINGKKRDTRPFFLSDHFVPRIESIKKRPPNREVHDLLVKVLEHVTAQEYEEAEKAFLQSYGHVRITELQKCVIELYDHWFQFHNGITSSDSFAPFFKGDEFERSLRAIKEALRKSVNPALEACIKELERCCKEEQYNNARGALLRAYDLQMVRPFQTQMQELFDEYQQIPLLTKWEENFNRLFSNTQFLPYKTDVPSTSEGVVSALRASKEAGDEGGEFHNNICTSFSSVSLYHLEVALDIACTIEDARVHQIYKFIYDKLQGGNAPRGVLFLLSLHAFFYLKKHGHVKGDYFFSQAEELNPRSLLFTCAKILQFPEERLGEYKKIMAVCESESKFERYLHSQREFLVESSLIPFVKAECLTLLQNEQARKQKRACHAVVDALIEKSLFEPAQDLCTRLPICPKPQVVVSMRLQERGVLQNALLQLQDCYQEKLPKLRAVKNVLKVMGLQSEDEVIEELLGEGKNEEAACYYIDMALNHFVGGNNDEANASLNALQALDPEYELVTGDYKNMLTLLQTLLVENKLEVLEI